MSKQQQYEEAVALPKREPQESEGARLDRTMSWSGLIFPLPEFCTDVELMARVRDRLRQL